MNESTVWLIYVVGFMLASFARGFFVERPHGDKDGWYIGNVVLPLLWPIYLPALVSQRAGDFMARFLLEIKE